MKVLVVDASVAVKWYVHEPDRDFALELLGNNDLLFIAPDIFLPEVVNALLRQHSSGDFAADLLAEALADLALTAPELIRSAALMQDAVALATRLEHPIYDCLYLALAERWAVEMITADRAFVKRCRERLSGEPALRRLRELGDGPIT